MTSLAELERRCEPDDIIRLLSPGMVTGLFDGHQWIDWTAESSAQLVVLSSCRKGLLSAINQDQFHILIDSQQDGNTTDAFLQCLARVSRGVAMVSSRLGSLLRWAPRIVAQPPYPRRQSGPFGTRTSGAVVLLRATTLQIVDRTQVRDSATLTVVLHDTTRAASVLRESFPDLRIDRSALHLPLRGYPAEEILGRLRVEGIVVRGSSVWYRLLQVGPR